MLSVSKNLRLNSFDSLDESTEILNSKKNSQNATNINLTKENLLFLGLGVILGLGIAFGSKLFRKKESKNNLKPPAPSILPIVQDNSSNLEKLKSDLLNIQILLKDKEKNFNSLNDEYQKILKINLNLTQNSNLIKDENNEIKEFTYDKKDYKDFLSYCELNKNLIEEIYTQINNGPLDYATQLAVREKVLGNKALMNMFGLFEKIKKDMSLNALKFTPEEVTKFSNQIMIEEIYIGIRVHL